MHASTHHWNKMRPLRLLFLGAATALPHTFSTRQVAPVSPECPESWLFNIASFSGPGCPDSAPGFNATRGHTDQGWGSHFVPGCHTPWAWFTLPYLEAKIGGGVSESETYCEMRLQWREMEGDNYPIDVPLDRAKWKLKMHRNGTTIEAGYAIDKGVYAKWKFTYWMNEDDQQSEVRTRVVAVYLINLVFQRSTDDRQLVDEVVVEGPLQNGKLPAKQLDWSQGKDKTLEWTAPRCGIASIKLRVDLELGTNALSSGGTVFPTRIGNGLDHDYGWQGPLVGVSHDFEPCENV